MNISIEFYKENGFYCAFIGTENGSGITEKGLTPDELGEKLAPYMTDFAYDLDDEGEEDDE